MGYDDDDEVIEVVSPKDRNPKVATTRLQRAMARKTRKKPWVYTAKLRPLAPDKLKSRTIVVFDYETTPISKSNGGDIRPYLVVLYDRIDGKPTTVYFDDQDDAEASITTRFLDHVLTARFKNTFIYAHNGGRFDFGFILNELLYNPEWENRGYRTEFTRVQSCILQIVVSNVNSPKDSWVFRDSLRLIPMGLEAIGKAFLGEGKLDAAGELGCTPGVVFRELCKVRHRGVARRYCAADCAVLWESLSKVQTLIHSFGGEMQITTASTAMDVWRRAFLKDEIFTNRHFTTGPRRCPDIDKLDVTCSGCAHCEFRAGFLGGRVEEFRTRAGYLLAKEYWGRPTEGTKVFDWQGSDGTMRKHRPGHLYMYDVKSHYPHSMLQQMPTSLVTVGKAGIDPALIIKEVAKGSIGFVRARVHIPWDCYIPPLPVRIDPISRRVLGEVEIAEGVTTGSLHAKLVFPVGTFTGIWDAHELALLAEIPGARIEEVFDNYWFKGAPIFASYVIKMYEVKEGKNKSLSQLGKLLMNSLFGKTGQKEIRSHYIISPTSEYLDERKGLIYRMLEGNDACDVYVEPTWKESDFVTPQIAAHVTAIARARLWRLLMFARNAGANVYYCDTDSLVVDLPVFETGTKLGDLELQHISTSARFLLPKVYNIKCHKLCPCKKRGFRKWKGLSPRGRSKQLGNQTWLNLAYHAGTYCKTRVQSITEGMKEFILSGRQFPRAVETVKQMRQVYDKRQVCDNGVDTLPLVVVNDVAYGDREEALRALQGSAEAISGKTMEADHGRAQKSDDDRSSGRRRTRRKP